MDGRMDWEFPEGRDNQAPSTVPCGFWLLCCLVLCVIVSFVYIGFRVFRRKKLVYFVSP